MFGGNVEEEADIFTIIINNEVQKAVYANDAVLVFSP